VLLEFLRETKCHPTAADLYEMTRRRLPRISLGTVYRNLECLVEQGLARKLETGGGEARFDGDVDPHHHVRCVECGSVEDAPELPIPPLGGQLPSVDGYEVLGYRLEFIGVCARCGRVAARHGERVFPGPGT
jgi:Fur family ferric uptake transcriptional regulator